MAIIAFCHRGDMSSSLLGKLRVGHLITCVGFLGVAVSSINSLCLRILFPGSSGLPRFMRQYLMVSGLPMMVVLFRIIMC